MTYNDLVSWVVRNQKFDLRNYTFRKFPIPLRLFFDKIIVKLGIDHVMCDEIAATNGQFISCHSFLPPIEVIETRLSLFLNLFNHGLRTYEYHE